MVGGRCFAQDSVGELVGLFEYEKGRGVILWQWPPAKVPGPKSLPAVILSGSSDAMQVVRSQAESHVWISEGVEPLGRDVVARYDPLYLQNDGGVTTGLISRPPILLNAAAAASSSDVIVYVRIGDETVKVPCLKSDLLGHLGVDALRRVVASSKGGRGKRVVKAVKMGGKLLELGQKVGDWLRNGDVVELVFGE